MLLNPKDPLVKDKFWKVKETYQFSALHLVYKLPTYRTILIDLQQGLATLQSLVYGGPRGSFRDSAFWLPSCPRTFFNLGHHSLLSVVTSETLIFFQWAFLAFQLRNSLINKSLLCQDLTIFFFICHSFIHSNSYPISQIPRIVFSIGWTHTATVHWYQKVKEWLWKQIRVVKQWSR